MPHMRCAMFLCSLPESKFLLEVGFANGMSQFDADPIERT